MWCSMCFVIMGCIDLKAFILIFGICLLIALAAEQVAAARHRRALKHVIHVNGTRGKSAVARLIAAGLSAGGIRTFCKTTGTLPMTIDVDGVQREIHRRGPANIREQLVILKQAAKCGAEVLVAECMAVDPELQWVTQHKMLQADISVITNARVDHVAEMGSTVAEVCGALCNTIPKNGVVFTADANCFPFIGEQAARLGSSAVLAEAEGLSLPSEPFPENVALALAVCTSLGVESSVALEGMKQVQRDPYAASAHLLPGGGIFLNGMSANDPASTEMILNRFSNGGRFTVEKLGIVLNCRPDRGYRTSLMLEYIEKTAPSDIYLMGNGAAAAERRLQRHGFCPRRCKGAEEIPLAAAAEGTLIYAIGNIADEGMKLMERVKKEGTEYVW